MGAPARRVTARALSPRQASDRRRSDHPLPGAIRSSSGCGSAAAFTARFRHRRPSSCRSRSPCSSAGPWPRLMPVMAIVRRRGEERRSSFIASRNTLRCSLVQVRILLVASLLLRGRWSWATGRTCRSFDRSRQASRRERWHGANAASPKREDLLATDLSAGQSAIVSPPSSSRVAG